MIPISKHRPPKELVEEIAELKTTPDASVSWDGITNRQAIREALCHEQGCICAYCMRRIDANASHVEHIIPQSECSHGQDVDYGNMLAVCNGNDGAGNKGSLTCDRARQNSPLTVNPLIPSTLSSIKYNRKGVIYSTDENVQKDLDQTLNLNCDAAYLPQNRQRVIQVVDKWMEEAAKKGNIVSACIKRRNEIIENNPKPDFAGVILFFLGRRIHRGR